MCPNSANSEQIAGLRMPPFFMIPDPFPKSVVRVVKTPFYSKPLTASSPPSTQSTRPVS